MKNLKTKNINSHKSIMMEELKDKVAEAAPGEMAEAVMPMAETPVETPAPKSSEAFRGRIKNAYPDQEFGDDEAYFQKAMEQLDNLEQYKNGNMEANKLLMEIFNAEPVIVKVLEDVGKGASFREAIARHFSPEELTPVEGDPDMEGWNKNSQERSKKLADNELANKTRAENEEFTRAEIKAFAEKNGISPEKAEAELEKIGAVLDEAYSGRISAGLLQTIYNGVNHDNDVATATETARIAGRNEQIETKKEAKPKGDGLPVIADGKNQETPVRKKTFIDEVFEREKRKQIL